MADNKKSVNFLPEYLKTDKNSKFLSATIDPLIQTPQLERIDGFVGSKITPNYDPTTDFYIKEDSSLRTNYSLDPALVFKDATSNITDVVAYDDIINEIKIQGGKTNDLDRLFRTKFYSYDPYIEWDKLVNYSQYYWLPNGPDSIVIDAAINVDLTIIGMTSYAMPNGYFLSNGMKIKFSNSVLPNDDETVSKYAENEYYVEGVGKSISLIALDSLVVNESVALVYNETFDSDLFDYYPFDGNKRIPLTPEYVTINRASQDLNPWTRYNRWFHGEIIRITAEINKQSLVYPLKYRAQRPIIEFKPNLQLFNFGRKGIQNVDVIDTDTISPLSQVSGTVGYYVDNVLLEQGQRVIFNGAIDPAIRANVYQVKYDKSTNSPTLILDLVSTSDVMDSVEVNYGDLNGGTSWYYGTQTVNGISVTKWFKSQQHTTLNQAPLFDLFDASGISYSDKDYYNSNLTGCKIFGYELGTVFDKVLGFSIKYQNSVGIGSYVFNNYFMSDVLELTDTITNVTSTSTTGITYFKINDGADSSIVNAWTLAADYQIPVVEVQTVAESTSTLQVTSFNKLTNASVTALVNNSFVNVTLTNLTVTFEKSLKVNDVVSLEITSDAVPNSKGFYKTPLSLTNNPLNGPITYMTLTEISDHVRTMIDNNSDFVGNFPGTSNLRDLTDYSKYGKRLIINENPIAFAQTFLGKKEHNAVDAIRYAGNQYNQFKMNLLRVITNIGGNLSSADALDAALLEINANRDSRSPHYRSDMIGYGSDKVVRTYTVSSPYDIFPTGVDNFDLSTLSFRSILVYLNDVLLLAGKDYSISSIDDRVYFSTDLAVDDLVAIHYYPNTRGSFVPPTPSKLGLYPAYEPMLITDHSYVGGDVDIIQGHDGSIMKAYGDYRDAIILEFEKRVYNNIKVTYDQRVFDINAVIPGAFRQDKYALSDAIDILTKDFINWTGAYNIDSGINNTFDEGNPFTWNYTSGVDTLLGEKVSGYWRGIYKYFYDTDRPHTHPWEMLGFISMPAWWETEYGVAPYTSTNSQMWIDLENGYVRGTDKTLPNYVRSGLSTVIPVDDLGNLKDPVSFLVSETGYYDKSAKWKFGDQGPAETAWRRSSYWPFALNAAAALLDPCTYTSTMYDTSRTSLNETTNQLNYLEDDLYLNPGKLVIEGYNDKQTAGFGVYVVEKGLQKDSNYLNILKQDLSYLDFNLFHKLGGFASKDKLQILIDSVDPLSQAQGALLPPEDYTLLLNVSNPIKSSSISGVVVQKYEGSFIVKGYDSANAYFEILKPITQAASGALTVGGKSEQFTEWNPVVNNGNSGLTAIDIASAESNTTRYYKSGQIVRYNGRYYRVKVGHNAQPTFDAALFYPLPSLPITGGATVQLSSKFESTVTRIPYGTSYSSIQEVYDLLIGYGAYLTTQGFIFDEFNSDLNEIMDWKYTGKEFLYWTTQNWADGSVITLSPFADYLKYSFIDSVVDDVSAGKYEYSLLKADGKSFPIDKFRLSRENGVCVITTVDTYDGIFFATLNSVQKEHGMVFNNSTIFNDTIYDIETGYKQRRMKISGFRTSSWNGDLSSPGFVYDNVSITDWTAFKSYLPGTVVRYNGAYYESNKKILNDAKFDFAKWTKLANKPVSNLLPNFDYKINQFEDFYSLDIDNFDATQQELAQHLVGYTPRNYLNNIFTNPVSQYKFYQGFIKEKGTKNAITKLSKVGKFTRKGDISISEDWAFRAGEYGSFSTYNELEFTLHEGISSENPYATKIVDTLPLDPNPLINYVLASSLLIAPDDYVTTSTFNIYPSTYQDNNIDLPNAGYVRADDVTVTAYNKNSLLDIANNSLIKEGNTIWLGFLENGGWTVYRYADQAAKVAGVYVNAPGESITFTTDLNHGLSVGDIISIVRFNSQVNGIYIVSDIPSLNQFTVPSTLATITDDTLLSYGALFKFENVRYSSVEELSKIQNVLNVKYGEKVWIDSGEDGKWKVYEKIKNYSTVTNIFNTLPTPLGQHLGTAIHASDDYNVVLSSAPEYTSSHIVGIGSVWVLAKNNVTGVLSKQFEYTLNNTTATYCDLTSSSAFGFSLGYDNNKKLYYTGAPEASSVRGPSSPTGVVTLSTGSGNVRGYTSEGLVKIGSKKVTINQEKTEAVLLNPYPASDSRFGHSIYNNQVSATTSTTLLVGAPGAGTGGKVYAYSISSSTVGWVSAHPHGINLTSHVSLTSGSQFGQKISGDTAGSIIAISAPYHVVNTSTVGVVQLFDSNLNWFQTLTSPFGTNSPFGDDISVSPDGSYLFVSSINTKLVDQSYGKVAVYKKALSGIHYNATRAEVILALAANLLAPVYYGEETILNWMIQGLTGFDQFWIDYRATHPEDASIYDAERTADAFNAVETRANVISAYQNNVDAQLYPAEADIRYWMLNGLGVSNSIFDQAVITANIADPEQYAINLAERQLAGTSLDYIFALHQIIDNPVNNYNLKFGTTIAVSKDNNTLAVGSLGINKANLVEFDINSRVGETTFDGGITQFIESIPDSGSVYVFNNMEGHFISVEELTDKSISVGSRYGTSISITNDRVLIGAPSTASSGSDTSTVYQFDKINKLSGSWKLLREQSDLVDPSTINRVALIDNQDESIIEYLEVIDPLKGKIAGIASQELKFRSAIDPATYSIGLANNIVDSDTSWIDDHIGELWWDLSTVKYTWYEQGDEIFRKNNWGKLFPGSSIDVYEWVKSDLLPSEWAAQADTTAGLTKGISGQPKYPDNSSISVKQLFNNVTNSFENVYYFWVKNKVTVPDSKNRRISSYQISKLIADPVSYGLKFAEIISPDSVAFANIQPSLVGSNISVNIAIDNINNEIPKHTEWVLLAEGEANDVPTPLLEKKLFDSLLGHDSLGNNVPDLSLTSRNKYGIGIRPRQTMFKDRLTALRNLVDFANSVLIKNIVTENEYSFDNLKKTEPLPDEFSREYDEIVDVLNEVELNSTVDTKLFKQAILECSVENGKIVSVNILNPGYGYKLAPAVTVVADLSGAELLTVINGEGRVISVSVSNAGYGFTSTPQLIVRPHTYIIRANSDYNGRWTKHIFNYSSEVGNNWTRIKNQTYNTPLYWGKVDWVSPTYNKFKDYSYVIPVASELYSLYESKVGDYVKVNNIGDGYYAILEKIPADRVGNFSTNFDIIYRQNGTIQISEKIWNYIDSKYSYDIATLDETLYDQIPDLEVLYILQALKEDIFVNDLKINWNLFFFAAVRYALTEQKLLDWAFKTSFITVVNQVGSLDQRPVYKLDNEQYFEEYVKEVKPYHSHIRSYVSKYTYLDDQFNSASMDFDMPSYFNTLTQNYEIVTLDNGPINQQPWKAWADNYKYSVGSIVVCNPGAGYTQRPTVTITGGGASVTSVATAEAYIRSGKLYQVLVTDPGEGYTETPVVTIVGGGAGVTTTAIAAASLLNLTTRKNKISLRFNRTNSLPEIGIETVSDTFICSGNDNKFELSILAEPNKLTIVPVLSGKLVLSEDYTIEYYTKPYNGYSKKYSRFVFLNYVPARDQEFNITYKKNIELYTAVDMIEKLYTGTFAISELMTGTVYPNAVVQGLPFNYSPEWDTVTGYDGYDNDGSAWSDTVGDYASAKLINDISRDSTVLYLDTVDGIMPGQVLNTLGVSYNVFRNDTVVESVDTDAKSITINQPHYLIGQARSTATSVGTDITFKTRTEFNGDIIVGDRITIDGISDSGFNGTYNVKSIIDTDKFIVTATSVLSTTTTYPDISSSATISTIVRNLSTGTVLLDHVARTFTMSSSTYILNLSVSYKELSQVKIRKNNEDAFMPSGVPIVGPYPAQEYFYITETPAGNVTIEFYQMTDPSYYLDISLYADPVIEFWNTAYLPSALATLTNSVITSTFDVDPVDHTIDGDAFLNIRNGYAPEECVAGTVVDSLGINVYTKAENSYAMVYSGSFPISSYFPYYSYTLPMPFDSYAVLSVHFNGTIFEQVADITAFTKTNQYYMEGNTINFNHQDVSGIGGYTLINVGGDYSVLDGNMVTVNSGADIATVESLASINDVRSAYVLVDGKEVNEVASSSEYGYMITEVSPTDKRASVKVYNLPNNGSGSKHTIQAWFFESEYTNFNRIHEEIFDVGESTSLFTLSMVPGNAEPVSEEVIVEVGTTTIQRLSPPSASYYKVQNNQRIFDIDNKHVRDPDTYISDNVSVYANGVKLRSGFEYTVNTTNSKVTIANGLLRNGDVVAVVGLIDGEYDYLIDGDTLGLASAVSNTTVRVISFTDHDNMMVRTEVFDGTPLRKFSLSLPILNDNYIWVYVNGIPLTARFEFEVLEDSKTIQISNDISVAVGDKVTITTINPPAYGSQILGYRMFEDMFGRIDSHRLSEFYSTTLAQPLTHDDTEIHVVNATKLYSPDPLTNTPGVVLIDGERIEFLRKDGNILRQLRRSTLGTGPANVSDIGTKVIDQSQIQILPHSTELTLVQTTSTTSTTYIINTVTNSVTGDGIVFVNGVPAVDQVSVYYGGRQLRKSPLVIHDKFYDLPILDADRIAPEFSINTLTNELSLNISDINGINTDITIVQKQSYVWTGTNRVSLITSTATQAVFMRDKESVLPDMYYYGG